MVPASPHCPDVPHNCLTHRSEEGDLLRILALCPQTPCGYNAGGGPTRTHFLLRPVAARHALSLAVLDHSLVPRDLAQECEAVYQPPIANDSRRSYRATRPRLRTILENVLLPRRLSDPDLLDLAERNCYRRPERSNGRGAWLHALYGSVLQREVRRRTRRTGLRPARGFERVELFHRVLPDLVAAHAARPFDCLWVEHTYLLPEALELLDRLPGLALVADAHNVEWVLHDRMAARAHSGLGRRWMQFQTRMMRAVENEGLSRAALTLCCSEDDARTVRSMVPDAERVRVVENGVDTEFYQPVDAPCAGPVVTYVGSYGYAPNRDAVHHFYSRIFPRVRAGVHECRFRVAGFQAETVFGRLARADSQVEIASNVPDIREEFAHCQVVVVPLRAGSGTRFKILEAMAMGKPVVSTTLGAEGLEVTDGRNIILADGPGPFARGVLDLLKDPQRRTAMGREARALMLEKYDWRRITAGCDAWLDGVRAARRNDGGRGGGS